MQKHIKILMILMLVTLLQACGGSDDPVEKAMAKIDTDSPDGAMLSVVHALKNNDIKALMQSSMSSADYDKAVAEFEKAKMSPSESDKAQFAQMMGMLTGDGSVDQLMAMATPQLEQMRAQLPMMLMMGKGMASSAIQSSADIPTDQKESATKIVNTLMDFVSNNDILSEEVTRKAITAAVDTAKSLDMNSLDELQNMSFDDTLDKASLVLGGTKKIFNVYGISIDDVLSSIKVSDVNNSGDSAVMKVAYEFLGESFSQDVNMKKVDGKWTADK
jgi:major membrane immunogen (membrane-anchored lipoprotein)